MWKPKNNSLLRKKNNKGVILKQKGTSMLSMAKIETDWKWRFWKSLPIFSKSTNGDVAPLIKLLFCHFQVISSLKSALILGSGGQIAIWIGMTRDSFVLVLLLSDCRLFQRESMAKWLEVPTFLLVYIKKKTTTKNRPELSIFRSGINTAN